MKVPARAASGTDVTLTIVAKNAAATDMNYAVLRFSVAAKVRENNHLAGYKVVVIKKRHER